MVDLDPVEMGFKVYDPKVTVRNDILPPLTELQNCTTCHHGRALPADVLDMDNYHYHCKDGVKGGLTHIGLKHYDNDCQWFVRKK
jgi:hypothetical protein